MNKSELIEAVATKSSMTKAKAAAMLRALTGTITEALQQGEKLTISGFGTFSVSERAARKGRNPQTGKEMKIKASKSPKFKAGKTLKDKVA